MDVHLRALAAGQYDILAAWQLMAAGATRRMIDHRVETHGWRVVHRGVYALTNAPLTQHQRWIAAALTTPDSVLSHASAGACWGFRPFEASFETITCPGSGGRRRQKGLLVMRSSTLDYETTIHQGIPITTAARTVIDLAAHLDRKQTGRMFREALRLGVTTLGALKGTAVRHRGRRGAQFIGELATRYASLPYHRARSDAEG